MMEMLKWVVTEISECGGYWDIGIQQIWSCCKHQKPWIRLGRDEANSEYKLNCLVFQATSPSGRFVDGAAAVNGHVLSHIEAHGKHTSMQVCSCLVHGLNV
jgi:hypothetical protein